MAPPRQHGIVVTEMSYRYKQNDHMNINATADIFKYLCHVPQSLCSRQLIPEGKATPTQADALHICYVVRMFLSENVFIKLQQLYILKILALVWPEILVY